MMEGALITGGITVAYWIDFGMYFAPFTSADWRFPLALQILFAIIILIFILGLPESPRWLILKGRDHEAAEILSSLMELPVEDKFIQNELAAITEAVMETSKGSFLDLFTMGPQRNFHRVALAYINQMFQQISGINLITYYATILFKRIGLTGYLPVLLGALNGTEYFLASLIPIYIVERVGRRTLMLVGAAGMAGSMAILAGSDSAVRTGNKQAGIAEIVFLFVFNTFFAWGWLGMTWLYPAEIVPLRIRAPANALSTTANWIFNFMVVMITPVAFASIHENTYTIFAVMYVVTLCPCLKYLLTLSLSLSSVTVYLSSHSPSSSSPRPAAVPSKKWTPSSTRLTASSPLSALPTRNPAATVSTESCSSPWMRLTTRTPSAAAPRSSVRRAAFQQPARPARAPRRETRGLGRLDDGLVKNLFTSESLRCCGASIKGIKAEQSWG